MIKSNDLRINEYFQSRGMQSLDINNLGFEKDNIKPDKAYTDNKNKIFVKFIGPEVLNEKSTFLQAVMETVDFLKEANIAYLLLSKLHASIIDGKIFFNRGVGLLTYDKNGLIQEIIKPKIFSPINKKNFLKMPDEIFTEINNLKNRINLLEQAHNKLEEELNELRVKKVNIEVRERSPNLNRLKTEIHDGAPEFMRSNPWIEILSKRRGD